MRVCIANGQHIVLHACVCVLALLHSTHTWSLTDEAVLFCGRNNTIALGGVRAAPSNRFEHTIHRRWLVITYDARTLLNHVV